MSKKKYELTQKCREAKEELIQELDNIKKSKEARALLIAAVGIIALLTLLKVFKSSSRKDKLSAKQEKRIQDIIEKALGDLGGKKKFEGNSWLKIPFQIMKKIPGSVARTLLKKAITKILNNKSKP